MATFLKIYHVDFNFVCIRPAYLRAWLRRVADMGYNALLWEVEDKVQWTTCAAAVWPEAMSKTEFRRILAAAADLGLESIPLLQTVGHGEYILMQDAYRHMRELPDHHDCYCTEAPASRDFLKRLVGEYLDLFGEIRHFHLGGDEAGVFGKCPVCGPAAERIGRNALYARHVMDVAAPILARGARPGIWGDMVLSHPEQMDAIPRELMIWDWNYWDHDGPVESVHVWGHGFMTREQTTDAVRACFPEILSPDGNLSGFYTAHALQQRGYDVILCSAARAAGDSVFCPRTRRRARNIAGAARQAATRDLAGTCVTDWAVRLNSWETHRSLLPLAPMIAARPELSAARARQETSAALFGCDAIEFIDAVDLISEVDFPFSRHFTTGIQWNGLKDGLPPPSGYIGRLLADGTNSGRMDRERAAVDAAIPQIERGVRQLADFAEGAPAGAELLEFWNRAANLQLRQARAAAEVLGGPGPGTAAVLQGLKADFERLLLFDRTPLSAARSAALVYDPVIEFSTRF